MTPFSLWFDKLGFLRGLEFELNPVAFTVAGKPIAWYGIVICLGMILAYLISSRKATKCEGFTSDDFLDYILFTIPLGVVGARAFFVLTNLHLYKDFLSMLAVWNGGLAITGGIVFGIAAIVGVSLFKKQSCLRLLDAAAPGVLLAQAVGRWGNFFNGEVFGVETALPWAMSLRINGVEYLDRHPLFLYESLLNLLGFALIMIFYKKKRFNGQHAFFYLSWYGAVRTLLEPLRDTSYQLKFNLFGAELLFSQFISVLILLVGASALIAGFVLRAKGKLKDPFAPKELPAEEAVSIEDPTEEKPSSEITEIKKENDDETETT